MKHNIITKKLFLFFVLLFLFAPLLLGLLYAFLYSFGYLGLMSETITLNYWLKVLSDLSMYKSFAFSCYISFISLLLSVLMASIFSWYQLKRKNNYLLKFLLIPLSIPPLVVAFSFFYYLTSSGIIARILVQLGFFQEDLLEFFPRLVNDNFGLGIIITHIYIVFPLFALFFLFQAKKENIMNLFEIAKSLGASPRQFFLNIYIPLILKKTQWILALYFIFMLNAYEVPLLLGQSSPQMISVYIIEKMTMFNWKDIPLGYTVAIIYFFLIMMGMFLFSRNKKTELW